MQFSNQTKANQILVFGDRRKLEYPEKTSQTRVENQQAQPTYDAESGNRTPDTLVESEPSHHCANPAPWLVFFFFNIHIPNSAIPLYLDYPHSFYGLEQ